MSVDSVYITSSRIRSQSIGSVTKKWKTDELPKIQYSIAELLRINEGIYIKNYGIGTLATSSIRGGSAGHTAILWNGIPIQSPMLGLLDLSLLPISGVDEVDFTKGGSGATWGSGAIGGVIHFKNTMPFNLGSNWKWKSIIGSFGFHQHAFSFSYGKKNFKSSSQITFQKGDNDFCYTIGNSLIEKKQENGYSNQVNILQNLQWKLSNNQLFKIHIWFQNAYRQIPPLTTQKISGASQRDRSIRGTMQYSRLWKSSALRVNGAIFTENMVYTDTILNFIAPNQFWSTALDAYLTKNLGVRQTLLIGINNYYTQATSNGYSDEKQEYKIAPYLFWKYSGDRLSTQISVRQTFVDFDVVPIVPIIGLEYRVFPFWNIKFKISRNYRLPTLNDRYWEPGGNLKLLPESGWSQEFSQLFTWQKNKKSLKLSVTGFNRIIHDWILWTPNSDLGFWSASNIAEVWSRGLETHLQLNWNTSKRAYRIIAGYDFTRSTNQVALTLPKLALGSQLLYTPKHQGFVDFQYSYNPFVIAYHHQYTGSVSGINKTLSGYQIGDLRMEYMKTWKPKYSSSFFIKINNIWNTEYRVVERRPMPRRHIQAGIELQF